MKKLLILFTLSLYFSNCFSQNDTIVITNKIIGKKEIYYVIEQNKKIKQGKYEQFIDNSLVISGQYINNKESGVWTYYHNDKSIFLKYNFDNDSTIYCNPNDSNRPLIYFGNYNELREIVSNNMKYPEEEANNGRTGRVVVEILINKLGLVYDYKTKESVSWALDKEAIRVNKLLPQKWLPAIENGKPIDSKFSFPITFYIQ